MKTSAKQQNQEAEDVCNCPNCTYDREVQAHLSKLKPAQRQFFLDMYVAYCDAQYNLEEATGEQEDDEDDFEDVVNPQTSIMYH